MEYEAFNHTGAAATAIGILLSLGWVALYIFGWIWAWAWAWIDDADSPERNPIIDWSMGILGFMVASRERCWAYVGEGDEWSGRVSDGAIGFFAPMLILFLGPIILALSFLFYPVTLTIFCLYLIARLARFARRHKKLFDKHIKDPEAHK